MVFVKEARRNTWGQDYAHHISSRAVGIYKDAGDCYYPLRVYKQNLLHKKGLVPTKILDILAALQRIVALDLKTFRRACLRGISLWF